MNGCDYNHLIKGREHAVVTHGIIILCVLFFMNVILFIVSFPKSSLSHPLDSQVYFIAVHF